MPPPTQVFKDAAASHKGTGDRPQLPPRCPFEAAALYLFHDVYHTQ